MKRTFIRFISSFLIVAFLCLVVFQGFASATVDSTIVTEEEMDALYKEHIMNYLLNEKNLNEKDYFQPYSLPIGSTMTSVDIWTPGYLIEKQSKSGVYSDIAQIVLEFIPGIGSTVGTIINAIADTLEITVGSFDQVYAKTFISYTYLDKYAKVWTEDLVWESHAISHTRETYKHILGTITKGGYTYGDMIDYTRPNGYSPIKVEYAPHYNDDTWLKNIAYENWLSPNQPIYQEWW